MNDKCSQLGNISLKDKLNKAEEQSSNWKDSLAAGIYGSI